MNIITLENRQLTYNVIYQKKRKSVQIKISSSEALEITAPMSYPLANIEKILQQKSPWIIKHLSRLETIAANPVNKTIAHGATLLYLGEPHTLIFSGKDNLKPTIYVKDQQIFTPFVTGKTPPCLELLLKEWYRKCAEQLLTTKTAAWSLKITVKPMRITIKEQKTRWGSCSSRGNINYNWRIIMAPPAVIDYLVIHELCHLRVPNHSTLFWQEVARFCPNFKEHRAWLKNNGTMIMDCLTT